MTILAILADFLDFPELLLLEPDGCFKLIIDEDLQSPPTELLEKKDITLYDWPEVANGDLDRLFAVYPSISVVLIVSNTF